MAKKTSRNRYRRPPRRSTYETALEHASLRLKKAVDERTAALMKIESLNQEIPYLQNIVQALTPPSTTEDAAPRRPTAPYVAPPEPGAPAMDQEEYLQKFMPRTGRVTTTSPKTEVPRQGQGQSPDPDEFLSEVPGQEMLP